MTRQRDHHHHDQRDGAHSHEVYAARSHPEAVVLDIGGDLGALVIYTTGDLHGSEIEISAAGQDHARSHKEVLHRPTPGRDTFAAVFDRIPAGRYSLWLNDTLRERGVRVEAGRVVELDWRAAAAPATIASVLG